MGNLASPGLCYDRPERQMWDISARVVSHGLIKKQVLHDVLIGGSFQLVHTRTEKEKKGITRTRKGKYGPGLDGEWALRLVLVLLQYIAR